MGIRKKIDIINIKMLELSNNYLFNMRNHKFSKDNIMFKSLPEFVINDKGKLINAEYYLQYVGLFKSDKTEKYIFVDVNLNDETLSEEFSYNGVEDNFNDVDFREIISQTPSISLTTEDDFKHHRMFRSNYFIFETTYFSSYSHEYGDELDDIKFNLIGYLDNNMNKILYSELN